MVAAEGAERMTAAPAVWARLLRVAAVAVVAADVVHIGVVEAVPLANAAGAALTAAGAALTVLRPRAGVAVLAATTAALLVVSAPAALAHVPDPTSGVELILALVATLGRLVAVGAAVGFWRGASAQTARRVGTVAAALLALTLVAAGVAYLGAIDEAAGPGAAAGNALSDAAKHRG